MVQQYKTLVCIVSDSSILQNHMSVSWWVHGCMGGCMGAQWVHGGCMCQDRAEKIETFLGALDLFLQVPLLA
jgi:hypothetical protein